MGITVNNGFENEVLIRLGNVEQDLAFIKGKLEGRGERNMGRRDKVALILSIAALSVACLRVFW